MLDQQNQSYKDQADALAEQWVEAHGRARILQESRKPFLAVLAKEATQEAIDNGDKLSVAAAEQEAYSSPRYREFYKGMVEAEREAKRLELLYENHKLQWMKS